MTEHVDGNERNRAIRRMALKLDLQPLPRKDRKGAHHPKGFVFEENVTYRIEDWITFEANERCDACATANKSQEVVKITDPKTGQTVTSAMECFQNIFGMDPRGDVQQMMAAAGFLSDLMGRSFEDVQDTLRSFQDYLQTSPYSKQHSVKASLRRLQGYLDEHTPVQQMGRGLMDIVLQIQLLREHAERPRFYQARWQALLDHPVDLNPNELTEVQLALSGPQYLFPKNITALQGILEKARRWRGKSHMGPAPEQYVDARAYYEAQDEFFLEQANKGVFTEGSAYKTYDTQSLDIILTHASFPYLLANTLTSGSMGRAYEDPRQVQRVLNQLSLNNVKFQVGEGVFETRIHREGEAEPKNKIGSKWEKWQAETVSRTYRVVAFYQPARHFKAFRHWMEHGRGALETLTLG